MPQQSTFIPDSSFTPDDTAKTSFASDTTPTKTDESYTGLFTGSHPFIEFLPKTSQYKVEPHDMEIARGVNEAFDSLKKNATDWFAKHGFGWQSGMYGALATEPARFAAGVLNDPFTPALGLTGGIKSASKTAEEALPEAEPVLTKSVAHESTFVPDVKALPPADLTKPAEEGVIRRSFNDPYIGTPTGKIQRESLLTPEEDARLQTSEENLFAPKLIQPDEADILHKQISDLAGEDTANQAVGNLRLKGGTAAIEPNEIILPSAQKDLRTPPHIAEQEVEPGKPFADRAANFVKNNVAPAVDNAEALTAPIIDQSRGMTRQLADGLLVSGEKQLERMGDTGDQIRKLLTEVEYSKRQLYNKFAGPFLDITSNLSKDEIPNFVEAMDGTAKPMNDTVQMAVDQSRKITDEMGQMASDTGVRVRGLDNQIRDFQPISEYWPHRPVNTPVSSKNFIDDLMAKNSNMSRRDAERMVARLRDHSDMLYTAQHSRMDAAKFEYRKDLGAMLDHMADMSDAISRAKYLGPGDISNIKSPISQLIESLDPADKQRAYEVVRSHLRGGMDKNNDFYQGIKKLNNAVTRIQIFTKLGTFPISNLNNQLQTVLHGTFTDFAKGVYNVFANSDELTSLAKEYGTINVGRIPAGIIDEAGRKPVPFVGNLTTWSENFNRKIATGAGKGVAETLFKNAQAGNAMSIKRLQSLLIDNDITDVLKQDKLTPDQLKFATNRFVEISQQLASRMKVPPVWSNEPLIQIPLIFKRFSFQATKSIKDAMLMNPTRNIPLFLVGAPIMGELTGDMKSAVYGAVRGLPMSDETLNAISFELQNRSKFAERITHLKNDESDVNWLVNRLTADVFQSWGLGLFADMLQGALGGKAGGYASLAGPAIDQAMSIGTSALSGDVTNLGREALRSIPIAGPGLQKRFLPTKSQEINP